MLFIKKKNLIAYYLATKLEFRTWKSDHIVLLEELLISELEVPSEDFLIKGSLLLASISKALEEGGDLVEVIRAIGDIKIVDRWELIDSCRKLGSY